MSESQSQALVPMLLKKYDNKPLQNMAVIALGVLLLSGLAQVSFRLPWTPIPITGQTFGVTFIALCSGRKRALCIVLIYLLLGIGGLPVFAQGKSGFTLGPTTGYLVGMILSSFIVGWFADRFESHRNLFFKNLGAGFVGSAAVMTCGLIGLSFFVPFQLLLMKGFFPFIPGDIIKTTTAAVLATLLRATVAA